MNGYDVDLYWPELKLVVETHGLATTHHQVKYERAYVKRILGETAARLA